MINKEWMSISDMMSGLMLIFLFIAISFMMRVEAEKQEMQDVAIEYRDTKANLNEALYSEFEDELQAWDATITTDNSIIFNAPRVLFKVSSSELTREFKTVLQEFFPRYLKVLSEQEYKDEIKELRVEGHSSKSWKNATSKKEIYLKNMQLSQNRAYEVLSFCYSLDDGTTKEARPWLEKYFRANGMAFAKSKESEKSRRVEFVIEMSSEDKVYELLP
jgi:outer membrane protein OmpA-like peptidoglycan-associated protein